MNACHEKSGICFESSDIIGNETEEDERVYREVDLMRSPNCAVVHSANLIRLILSDGLDYNIMFYFSFDVKNLNRLIKI